MANERQAATSAPVAEPGLAVATAGSYCNTVGASHRSSFARVHRRTHRQQIIRGWRWGTLMRHVLLSSPIATGTRCMAQAAAAARLIAPTCRLLREATRLLRASRRAVDLAAIAAAADQHLGSAPCAQKKPRRRCRFGQPWAWTRFATGGILPRHSCTSTVWGTAPIRDLAVESRRLPALETGLIVTRADLHRSAETRRPVDMWTTQARALPTYPQAQRQSQNRIQSSGRKNTAERQRPQSAASCQRRATASDTQPTPPDLCGF
jgi:hypothetical protein